MRLAVTLRPVVPTDAPEIETFVRGLSDRSAHHRFHGPRRGLSARELARIVDVDHRLRETLVATDPGGRHVLALGQYVAVDDADTDPGPVAEVALVVADAWQGRGLGRLLAQRLLAAARDADFAAVTATVLADNRPALALADRLQPRKVPHGSTVEVRVDLDEGAFARTSPPAPHASWTRQRARAMTERSHHVR